MKRIVLALAVGFGALLLASASVNADDVKPVPATPVVVSGTTDVISTAPAGRMGLIAKLRAKRSGSTMTTMPLPSTGTIVTPTPSTTIPTPIPSPMPKPVIPASGMTTTMPMVTTAAYSVPATRTGLFSRMRMRSTTPATLPMTVAPAPMPKPMPAPISGVVPASGTVTMTPTTTATPMMMASTTTARMGLFARMKARRTM